jgi:hypothetical protein
MGVVFRAEDPQLGRPVALKALLPGMAAIASARERFLREARAAAALKHDHVVTIHQVGEDRGVPFLAMELLEGEPLDARLQREGGLPVAEVLRIGRETAEGLAAAHARGLVHRDIKPDNLWLESRGEEGPSTGRSRVKLLDFGLARAAGGESHLTQSGLIVGTPEYMAPEQAQGGPVDGRCDLFGQRGRDAPGVPPALSELILRLLAKEPEGRPASAAAVVAALAALEGYRAPAPSSGPPTMAPPPPLPSPHGPRRRKGPWAPVAAALAGSLLLLGVLLLGGVWVIVRGRPGKAVAQVEVPEGGGVEVRQPQQPGEAKAAFPPLDRAWVKKVEGLPAEGQVKEVAAELRRRNPGFDGRIQRVDEFLSPVIGGGAVTGLRFCTDAVTDVSPVRALPGLRALACEGSNYDKGRLTDLSPLRGLQLTNFFCPGNPVEDLGPLAGMPLFAVGCWTTRVRDLSPLKGAPLKHLYCGSARVDDLSPLKGMKLIHLHCNGVRDLSVLRGMPLVELNCDFEPERDAELLRSIKTLETINGKPAAEVLK